MGLNTLPPDLTAPTARVDEVTTGSDRSGTEILPIAELERQAIAQALAMLDGNVSEASRRLGIGRATLYRKMARYGLTDGPVE